MRVIVDLDGTLCTDTRPYKLAKPIEDNIRILNRMYEAGERIIIFTARRRRDRKITVDWLKKHGVKYHKLIMGKPRGDVYVDDKAINSEDFFEILKEMIK